MTTSSAPDPADRGTGGEAPAVSNIDVLKALADPVRMNLLYALTRGRGMVLPAMSVKELAAQLGEPQTKLYRHVKHLESAGLIRAVASRVVSGIIEQRYQACQPDLIIGDSLTDREKVSPEAEAMAAAALELYRRQFFAARRALGPDPSASGAELPGKMLLAVGDGWMPAAKAAAIRERLRQILDDVTTAAETTGEASAGHDLVPVNLLVGFFSPGQDDSG